MVTLFLTFALLVAQASVTFEDRAAFAGVAKGGNAGAVAWLDADGDGDQDLFVANLGRSKFFRNDGGGRFTKLKGTGLEGGANSFGVAIGDYDNDGRLDVFVANVGSSNFLFHNNGGDAFTNKARSARVGGGNANSYSAGWADYDRDGLLDLYVANGTMTAGAPNFLYHNEGDGTFAEVGASAGVRGAERSLGCVWGDYDDDGWPDLYVSNLGAPNALYRNNGDGTFIDRAAAAGVDDPAGNGAGAAWGDYDNDGHLDLYLFNTNAATAGAPNADVDRLYRNLGNGRFDDVTQSAGLFAHEDGEAVVWADFDNDGLLDLYLVNRSDFSRQRNHLFRNAGNGRFVDATAAANAFGSGSGQPAAAADYDGDGFVDLFVGNLPGADNLLRNGGGGGRSLVVRLEGVASNRAAVGARVVATAGGRSMTREIASSSGRSSADELAARFGLGDAAAARVEIRWPSGAVETLEDVPPGEVFVREGEGASLRP